jgi:16S rRNA (guanine527-N7)-methyltransferase
VTEEEARENIAARVSRETLQRLETYEDLLRRWQPAVNLVGGTTLKFIWRRHFLDSLQVFDMVPDAQGVWLDLGSGGGFPGLVCAIAAKERSLGLEFELVESDVRKCAFIREVARQTATEIRVHNMRIERLAPRSAGIISARALAPLPRLLELAAPHLRPDGICVFQKGASYREELETASAHWQMNAEILPSVTASESVILRIRNLVHAS